MHCAYITLNCVRIGRNWLKKMHVYLLSTLKNNRKFYEVPTRVKPNRRIHCLKYMVQWLKIWFKGLPRGSGGCEPALQYRACGPISGQGNEIPHASGAQKFARGSYRRLRALDPCTPTRVFATTKGPVWRRGDPACPARTWHGQTSKCLNA